jgi:hypothetical protein
MHMKHEGCLTESRTSAGRISDNLVEIIAAHSPGRSLMVLIDFLLDQLWVLLVVCLLETIVGGDSVAMLACNRSQNQ